MIARRVATVFGAACLAWAGAASAERDPTYLAGGDGWRFERFGPDVAILRTGVARVPATPAGGGSLFLSCEGRERRLRLTLPERLPELDGILEARVLVRPVGAGAGRRAVLARLAIEGGRLLAVSDTGSRSADVVGGLTRLIGDRPAGLEWLLVAGAGAVTPGRLRALVLALTFEPGEARAVDEFVAACRAPTR